MSDYLQVAPRYGTNEDLVAVVGAARARGIRVLLDLVAGHTSVEHAWFRAELHADGPSPDGDRYVGGRASTRALASGYPFVFLRAGTHLVVVNPRREAAAVELVDVLSGHPLLVEGVTVERGVVHAEGFGFGVFGLG